MVLWLLVVDLAVAIPHLDFVAAYYRQEFVGFELLFELLEVKILIQKHLACLLRILGPESRYSSFMIIDDQISALCPLIAIVLILFYHCKVICDR